MTLIVIAGGVTVRTLACAETPPAAIDSYVAAFMVSSSEQTSAIELRESHYLNNGLVNSSPRGLSMTTRTYKCDASRRKGHLGGPSRYVRAFAYIPLPVKRVGLLAVELSARKESRCLSAYCRSTTMRRVPRAF
jgi:hypothetical protein